MELKEMLEIQTLFKELTSRIEELAKNKIVQPEAMESSEIKELATALAKAQGEFAVAGKNKVNPFFKSAYADYMAVVSASRPALSKYGLSVTQDLFQLDDGLYLYTKLRHSSGQWIMSKIRFVPPKTDIQAMASYNTSLKRMAFANTVGVLVGDEDDDGESAVYDTRETFAKGVALNTKYSPKEQPAEVITKEQLDELNYELAEYPDIAEMVLDGLKIQSLADMPKSKFMVATKRIRDIKNTRNGNK